MLIKTKKLYFLTATVASGYGGQGDAKDRQGF
jgi:hypothetical protein